jgi:hypothetical protein
LVRDEEALEARMDADAAEKAHALIQGYLGPDHKVLNMSNFYSALVQTLSTRTGAGRCFGRRVDADLKERRALNRC